jgi:hypothetical protein
LRFVIFHVASYFSRFAERGRFLRPNGNKNGNKDYKMIGPSRPSQTGDLLIVSDRVVIIVEIYPPILFILKVLGVERQLNGNDVAKKSPLLQQQKIRDFTRHHVEDKSIGPRFREYPVQKRRAAGAEKSRIDKRIAGAIELDEPGCILRLHRSVEHELSFPFRSRDWRFRCRANARCRQEPADREPAKHGFRSLR